MHAQPQIRADISFSESAMPCRPGDAEVSVAVHREGNGPDLGDLHPARQPGPLARPVQQRGGEKGKVASSSKCAAGSIQGLQALPMLAW